MRTTIISVMLLTLLLTFSIASAEEETYSEKINWVSGVVESIHSGKDRSLISVVMQNGEIFSFSSTNDKLEGIDAGGSISAKVRNGWAESIQRLGTPVEIRKPKKKESEEYQWVAGEITAIQTGKENSLVSLKMSNGENFNFSSTNRLLQGISVGDRVRAKVYKGWAETITTDGS